MKLRCASEERARIADKIREETSQYRKDWNSVRASKGGTSMLARPSQCDCKIERQVAKEMQEEQRVPRHGRNFKGFGWHRTTNNRHQKVVLEMGSLLGYVGPQSATG